VTLSVVLKQAPLGSSPNPKISWSGSQDELGSQTLVHQLRFMWCPTMMIPMEVPLHVSPKGGTPSSSNMPIDLPIEGNIYLDLEDGPFNMTPKSNRNIVPVHIYLSTHGL
jgi:hypothetical protein